MSRRKLFGLLTAIALVASLVGGFLVVTASASPHRDTNQWAAKFVCGFVPTPAPEQEPPPVKPGNYATAINIGNTGTMNIAGSFRILLHYDVGDPPSASIPAVGCSALRFRTAEIDCNAIWAAVGVAPETFLKGIVHIGLGGGAFNFPVWAVYTAQTDLSPTPGVSPDAGAGISIDVERVEQYNIPAH